MTRNEKQVTQMRFKSHKYKVNRKGKMAQHLGFMNKIRCNSSMLRIGSVDHDELFFVAILLIFIRFSFEGVEH